MRIYLWYFFDLALIFQYEYREQNTLYQLEVFYSIGNPLVKTLLAAGVMESLWLIVCAYFNVRRLATKVAPGAVLWRQAFSW